MFEKGFARKYSYDQTTDNGQQTMDNKTKQTALLLLLT